MLKSKKRKNNFMNKRTAFVFILIIIFFILLSYRLVKIAFFTEIDYNKKVLNQKLDQMNKTSGKLMPKRGDILDINGIPLANSLDVYSVIYDPKLILELSESDEGVDKEINNFLYENLPLAKGELERLLDERHFSHYEKIAISLDYASASNVLNYIDNGTIKGVTYEKTFKREYPKNNMASDVIGFLSKDGLGLLGIEKVYDEYLKGNIGRQFGSVMSENDFEMIVEEEKDGANVILNINSEVQKYVMEAIDKYVKENNPSSMEVIIMDPRNADVIAMASYPNFNLNSPYDLSSFFSDEVLEQMTDDEIGKFRNELWKNRAISDTYEPGSTFKPFTLAMGIEEFKVDASSRYLCNGYKIPFENEKPIHCHKLSGHGEIDYKKALASSCNVAFMDMGVAIGKKDFAKYSRMFGFGSITSIDLNGETSARNLIYKEDELNPVELQTSSFGQGFNITPIQLITGFSSLVNGGYLFEPHIANRIEDKDGNVIFKNEKEVQRVVISKETAAMVSSALAQVVDDGSGRRAKIEGYTIGGKTGQAEKGDREIKDYVVSFIGYSPIENPEIIGLVVIDDPDKEEVSSLDAILVFRDIMEDVFPYMRITRDYGN